MMPYYWTLWLLPSGYHLKLKRTWLVFHSLTLSIKSVPLNPLWTSVGRDWHHCCILPRFSGELPPLWRTCPSPGLSGGWLAHSLRWRWLPNLVDQVCKKWIQCWFATIILPKELVILPYFIIVHPRLPWPGSSTSSFSGTSSSSGAVSAPGASVGTAEARSSSSQKGVSPSATNGGRRRAQAAPMAIKIGGWKLVQGWFMGLIYGASKTLHVYEYIT